MPRQATRLNLRPRYNGCPTQDFAVCWLESSERAVAKLRWGLIPAWAKDEKIGARLINARSKTVHEKPEFHGCDYRVGLTGSPQERLVALVGSIE